jgi:hypothetical protein
VVASQAAMLALTAETGDVAIRTDLNESYILTASPASTLANWQELLTPPDAVASVDGRVGNVTLSDLYAAKTHASTHASGGTDAVTLAQSQVTSLTSDLAAKAPLASPTFTGTLTTPNVIVTGSTVPANGVYLPAANTVGVATNSGVKLQVNSVGEIGVGTSPSAGRQLFISGSITGSSSGRSLTVTPLIMSDITAEFVSYRSNPATTAATFTLANLVHFNAVQGTFGASSTVTSQIGYYADASISGAVNNFGFYGAIGAAANRWNFYAGSTAANHFLGQTVIGSTSLTLGSGSVAQQFGVVAGATTTVGIVVRGAVSATANLQEWQNSAGTANTYITSGGKIFSTSNTVLSFLYAQYVMAGVGETFVSGTTSYFKTIDASTIGIIVRATASQTANLQEWQNSAAGVLASVNSSGTFIGSNGFRVPNGSPYQGVRSTGSAVVNMMSFAAGTDRIDFGGGTSGGDIFVFNNSGASPRLRINNSGQVLGDATVAPTFGGGVGVIFLGSAATVPTSNPTGGGILYVESGALKYRGSSGTVTTLGAA